MDSPENNENEALFSKRIASKERLKLKALGVNSNSVWAGLGMFGMIGWSVAIPTLLGAALGIWLDRTYRQSFSWTLTFLILGLFTGCIASWYWISNEDKETHKNNEQNDQ